MICEIQQNSNLTYRVYDYGRKDKNGNERELHVEKALLVTDLKKRDTLLCEGDTLAACKYFTVDKIIVEGETALYADEKSFECITCVSGKGTIDGQTMSAGDSYFVPAGFGAYTLSGNCIVLKTRV